MIEARPATAADFLAVFGKPLRDTVYGARALQMDGKVVSVAGLVCDGTCLRLFWNIVPGHEDAMKTWQARRALVPAIRELLGYVTASPVPVVAVAGNHDLLKRLGFEQIEGDDYLWVTMPSTPNTGHRCTPAWRPKAQPETTPHSSDPEPACVVP